LAEKHQVNGESGGGNSEDECVISFEVSVPPEWYGFDSTRLLYCCLSSKKKQRHFGIRRIMTDVTGFWREQAKE
jgi:hypothetical protein